MQKPMQRINTMLGRKLSDEKIIQAITSTTSLSRKRVKAKIARVKARRRKGGK